MYSQAEVETALKEHLTPEERKVIIEELFPPRQKYDQLLGTLLAKKFEQDGNVHHRASIAIRRLHRKNVRVGCPFEQELVSLFVQELPQDAATAAARILVGEGFASVHQLKVLSFRVLREQLLPSPEILDRLLRSVYPTYAAGA